MSHKRIRQKAPRNAVITTSRQRSQNCPNCGRYVDAVTGAGIDTDEPVAPNPGDTAMCAYCGALLIFGKQMEFRFVPPAEEAAVLDRIAEPLRELLLMYRAKVRQ